MKKLILLLAMVVVGTVTLISCGDNDNIFDEETPTGDDTDTETGNPTDPSSGTDTNAPSSPECTNPTWAAMATGYDVSFDDVWAASPNNVYAVTNQGVLFHYDGSVWSVEDFNAGCPLDRIEGRSASDIYMGGHDENCLFHFDGSQWSQVAAPPGGVRDMTLTPDGMIVTNRTPYGEAAYLNAGAGWQKLEEERLNRQGVAARSMTDIYFLGSEMSNCIDIPSEGGGDINCDEYGHVLRYDGATVTSLRRTQDMFYDDIAVDPASNRVFITGIQYFHEENRSEAFVGFSDDDTNFEITVLAKSSYVDSFEDIWVINQNSAFIVAREGVVYHFNGTSWTQMNTGSENPFNGIHGTSATDIFAVGTRGINHYGCDHGDTSETDDPGPACEWTKILDEEVGEIDALWVNEGGFPWFTSSNGVGLIGAEEEPYIVSDDGRFDGMHGAGDAVFVGGQGSQMRTCFDNGCVEHTSPLSANYWGVFALSPTEAYFVGDNGNNQGVIVKYLDGNLTEMPISYNGRLTDVWAASSNFIVAVGESGVITYDGALWQTAIPNTDENINIFKVYGSAQDDIYVTAGTEYADMATELGTSLGTVWHFDGVGWNEVSIDDTVSFRDVFVVGSDDVFAAGTRIKPVEGSNEGVVYHYDGASWREMNNCFDMRISAIHGNAGKVYLTLPEGGLYQYNATTSSPDPDDDTTADSCEPLSQGNIIEYYASVGKGETIVVVRPEEDWSYEDFRLFYQATDGLLEKIVTNVVRYKDGGTTVIDFMLNDTLEAILTFPVHIDADADPSLVLDPASMVIDGTTLEVTRYDPTEFVKDDYTFLCLE